MKTALHVRYGDSQQVTIWFENGLYSHTIGRFHLDLQEGTPIRAVKRALKLLGIPYDEHEHYEQSILQQDRH